MNVKTNKTKKQANVENQAVNLLSKEELCKRIEDVEKELKSYTWRELETNGKFAKNDKLSFIKDDMLRSIEALGEIDGAMLLDQYGRFYMIGVILDGTMPPKGVDKGRGARYNSAVKYSYSHKEEKHLLIIISEDGYFDMINYNYI